MPLRLRGEAAGVQIAEWSVASTASAETIRSMVAMGLGFSLANAVPHPRTRSFQGMPVRYLPVINPEFSTTIVGVTMAEARVSKKLATALTVLKRVAEETDPSAWTTEKH